MSVKIFLDTLEWKAKEISSKIIKKQLLKQRRIKTWYPSKTIFKNPQKISIIFIYIYIT